MNTVGQLGLIVLLFQTAAHAPSADPVLGSPPHTESAESPLITTVGPIRVLEFKVDHAPLSARVLVDEKVCTTAGFESNSLTADLGGQLRVGIVGGRWFDHSLVAYFEPRGFLGGLQCSNIARPVWSASDPIPRPVYGPKTLHLDNRTWVDIYRIAGTSLWHVAYSRCIQIK